jgi:hypothetical protein
MKNVGIAGKCGQRKIAVNPERNIVFAHDAHDAHKNPVRFPYALS